MTTQEKNLGSGCLAVIAWGLVAVGIYVAWKLFSQPPAPRDFSGQVIGMLICFGLGGGLLVFGGRARSKARRLARGMAEEPDRPWLWRDDWAKGRIEASFLDQYGMRLFVGGGGLLFAVVGARGLLTQQAQSPAQFAVGIMALLLGLAGSGWLALCVLSRLWHGGATFEMARTPAALGGRLEGVVIAGRALKATPKVTVTLRCLKTVEVKGLGDPSDTHTETRVLWEDERIINRLLETERPGLVGVPVRFWIPSSEAETNEEQQIAWRLEVTAATPVVRYRTSFEVPVFATGGAAKEAPAPDDVMNDYEVDQELADALAAEGLRYVETAGGVAIISPPWRLSPGVMFLCVTTLVLVAMVFIWISEGMWFGVFVTGICVPLLGYMAAEAVLGCTELRIQGDRWRVRSGWVGFRREEYEFASEEIESFNADTLMTVNAGTHMQATRHLYAIRHEDYRVLLVRSLRNRATERWLLAELRRRAGLENPYLPPSL